MSLKPHLPSDTLELTIRFTVSLPDLHLSISLFEQPLANTSTLKQLIRTHLPTEHASRRIRLIYSGKALADDAALSASLKRPPSHPPSRSSTPRPPTSYIGRGNSSSTTPNPKTPIREPFTSSGPRIYIHCSLGDLVLTPAELANEARLAHTISEPSATSTSTSNQNTTAAQDDTEAATGPPQRGFDRLLSTGFTATEVSSLRMQFLAIHARTHIPDEMPSPTTLRNMEDQWLDNSGGGVGPMDSQGGEGGAGGGGLPMSEESEAGAIDDMIYGAAMGFFWPIGCLMWAWREEGVWSERRKMAVGVGVVLNVALGLVRYTG
ncbi:uncharacterized protein HMPREF1541_07396 [Cyphellophora europaea CBS 101466]|uniref:Ubiquitin-like domain-containing protein n=1 Tax=Cyphellophora europaea (strain CBS 101466) TaxID=1220924 RepID=W2RPY9_CYPE1|nr:uncharacterized protein HMPREF1541_07396 [Cyphellophora europaea CBS 101466]ETN37773.1 hypothetical protein HMPREF1541_07396 [Cyphellophora europaea CBS 101466]